MCLTLEKLAEKVGVDLRTLNRWMAGGELYAQNLSSLARALGTTARTITEGEPLTGENNIVNVNLHFNISLSSIQRPEDVKTLLNRLKAAIGALGDMGMSGEPQEGSVILALEMSEDDWERLMDAFLSGNCDEINLVEIISPPAPDLLTAVDKLIVTASEADRKSAEDEEMRRRRPELDMLYKPAIDWRTRVPDNFVVEQVGDRTHIRKIQPLPSTETKDTTAN